MSSGHRCIPIYKINNYKLTKVTIYLQFYCISNMIYLFFFPLEKKNMSQAPCFVWLNLFTDRSALGIFLLENPIKNI